MPYPLLFPNLIGACWRICAKRDRPAVPWVDGWGEANPRLEIGGGMYPGVWIGEIHWAALLFSSCLPRPFCTFLGSAGGSIISGQLLPNGKTPHHAPR
jgi:hypothetical protein